MKNIKLKTARNKAGLTQTQVAKAAGVTEVAYQNYEAGQRIPRVDIAIRIAETLGVDVKDIFGNKEAK